MNRLFYAALILVLGFFQTDLKSQCSPTALEIPNNGIDEDCDGLDDIFLVLPPFAYTLVGQDFEIYFRNLILSKHPNDYVFEVSTPISGGQNLGDRWKFTPTAAQVGTAPLSISVKTPNGTTLATASTTLRITSNGAPADLTAKKLILFGHSYFDQGYLPKYVADLVAQPNNPPISFHGKKQSWAAPFPKHEGYGGMMWRWFLQNPASPFLYGGQFKIKNYFDDVCGGAGQRPDWMLIHLDINDFCGYTPLVGTTLQEIDDSITNDWNAHAKRIIDSIRIAAPNCKLAICLSPPPNARQSAFDATYGGNPVLSNQWRWKKIISRLLFKNIARYANREAENIYLLPEYLDVDDFAEYNPPDARHLDPADGIITTHCGYNEIAKSIYAWIKFIENQSSGGGPQIWYQDADGDGFGNPSVTQNSTTQPTGFVANSNDCNDQNSNINPSKTEICGNGVDDNCNGQVDESPAPPTNYCTSTSTYPWEDWISAVKIGATEKTSGKTPYSDFTSTTFTLTQNNTITLTTGYSYSTFDEYWRGWIDFNKDGDFNDAGEQVFEKLLTKPAVGQTSASATASFSTPSGLCGTTRMRVSMTRSAFPTACQTLPFGEIEDFTVLLTNQGGGPTQPDLLISSATIPATIQAGNSTTISFSIKNAGAAGGSVNVATTAWLSTDNSLSVNDLSLGSTTILLPSAGSTTVSNLTFSIPNATTAGPYFLILKTDDGSVVAEIDETNNLFSQAVSLTAAGPTQPDLLISAATIPASIQIGNSTTISFSIKNAGASGGSVNVATTAWLSSDNLLSVNDLSLGSTTILLPSAGATTVSNLTFTIPNATAAGPYFLILKTDDGSVVAEIDETNNLFSQAVSLTAAGPTQPDLLISSATIPASIQVGNSTTISFSIKNAGAAGAAQNVATTAWLSTDNSLSVNDLSLGSTTILLPSAGATTVSNLTFSIPNATAAGPYFLILKTDDGSVVAELDETNNQFSQAVSLTAAGPTQPDLLISSATIPASIQAGGAAMIAFSVKNIGGDGGSVNVATRVWLSTDNSLSVNDLDLGAVTIALPAAGQTTTVNYTISIANGTAIGPYFLLFKTDETNAVVESDETNNGFSQAVSISASGSNGTNYCASTSDFPWHDWISKVRVGTLEKSSDKSQYSNFTATAPFTVSKTATNQVKLTVSYSSEVFDEYWRIWIDFNKDGDFLDVGEQVFSAKLNKPAAGTVSVSLFGGFGIYSGAATGLTRMRVSMKRTGYATPCETLAFGEVEDYTVNVMSGSGATDGSVVRSEDGAAVESSGFAVFPNPAMSGATLDLFDFLGKKCTISISNSLGQPVFQREIEELREPLFDLDLSDWMAGTYFIFVQTEGRRASIERLAVVRE